MTFAEAINTIVNGSSKNAIKRPAWGGYVYRSAITAATGAFTLTFKTRSGTEYVYSFSGSAWSAPSTSLSIDAELMRSFLADDWITGTSTDFEASRSGQGVW